MPRSERRNGRVFASVVRHVRTGGVGHVRRPFSSTQGDAMTRLKLSQFAPVLFLFAAGLVRAEDLGRENYHKAREILDAAVAATGGAEKLNAIQTITLDQKGT